jgi:hypothetical protein
MEGSKLAEVPKVAEEQQPKELVFSLVLESRMRQMLEKEARAAKKGHHRKLTKKDHDRITDELNYMRFDAGILGRTTFEKGVAVGRDFEANRSKVDPPVEEIKEEV